MCSDKFYGRGSNGALKTLKRGVVEFQGAGWWGIIWVLEVASSEKRGGGSGWNARIGSTASQEQF